MELLSALRERKYFILAREHGKSPSEIREWSDYDVERAWLYYITTADSKEEFTPDDVKETKARIPMAAKTGYILDCDYTHWQKFITDGVLDSEKLAAGNYSPDQVEYIQGEMNTLGWLGENAEETTPDHADTNPPEIEGEG